MCNDFKNVLELNSAYCWNNSNRQQCAIFRPQYAHVIASIMCRYNTVGIATCYGMDGSRFESR